MDRNTGKIYPDLTDEGWARLEKNGSDLTPIDRMPQPGCEICGGSGSVIGKGQYRYVPCECTMKNGSDPK